MKKKWGGAVNNDRERKRVKGDKKESTERKRLMERKGTMFRIRKTEPEREEQQGWRT